MWSVIVLPMDNILRPMLIKRGVNLPLLLVFAGVIGGLISFGMVGIFIGPVVLAVAFNLMEAWIEQGPPPAADEPASPDSPDLLKKDKPMARRAGDTGIVDTAEQKRLNDAREAGVPWKKWGPYLSERQWGTVREDYSPDGNAWDYFTHDQSRSRAYRWGEDGLGGISDDKQRLCFALALWNERDPILKERLFGLTNGEGNHGEDVKEYYFYVDSTPTHSYMKYLYKYPQREFPYRDLVDTNRPRTREEFEYELLDTGIFDDDRYFDVFLEYAKEGPDDILIRVSVHNRGKEAARLHLLPTLWFRNTWSWGDEGEKPVLREDSGAIVASHPELGEYTLSCDGAPELLFTENESNAQKLWGQPNADALRQGRVPPVRDLRRARRGQPREDGDEGRGALRPRRARGRLPGRPAPPRRRRRRRERSARPSTRRSQERLADADEFYDADHAPLAERGRAPRPPPGAGGDALDEAVLLLRPRPLAEGARGASARSAARAAASRNTEWFHMLNGDVISMPDKWEYPWYAAWDLAFHTISLSLVDFDFAKEQLLLMLRSLYSHPNGQIPAYEWNFSDVNPPVHAWATLFLYKFEKNLGREDIPFLERSFQGLMLNFNWWVNRKDPQGRTSSPAASWGSTTSASSTAAPRSPPAGRWSRPTARPGWPSTARTCWRWPSSSPTTTRCTRRSPSSSSRTSSGSPTPWTRPASSGTTCGTRRTASTTTCCGCPDGDAFRLKVRSMVGLLPLCASTMFEADLATRHPKLVELIALFKKRHPDVIAHVAPTIEGFIGHAGRRLLSPLTRTKLERILVLPPRRERVPQPATASAPSRATTSSSPFVFHAGGQEHSRPVPARRVQHGDVRGELELARAGLDAGQRAARSAGS